MLGTALLLQIAELGAWFGLYQTVKRQTTRQILTYGRPQPTRIPIVDKKLEQLAGHPSKTTRAVTTRVVAFARKLVNTKAFEHVVVGMANSKSPLRKRLRRKSKLVMTL